MRENSSMSRNDAVIDKVRQMTASTIRPKPITIILNALKWRAGADSISNIIAKMPEDLSGLIKAVAG